jgi:hypothetical protein
LKRKLRVLNVVLVALLVLLGLAYRRTWQTARARASAVLGRTVPIQRYPPLPAAPTVPPFNSAGYIQVAQNFLFSADRNSTVIVDPTPPPKKPPMPPLPTASGLMMIGEPAIILTDKPGAQQKIYHQGDSVGDFKLVTFNQEHVVFDWDGETVDRPLAELMKKDQPAAAPPPAASAARPPAVQNATVVDAGASTAGPGVDVGGGYRGCQAGDTSPVGTEVDGYKKFEVASPFGKSCGWKKVQ